MTRIIYNKDLRSNLESVLILLIRIIRQILAFCITYLHTCLLLLLALHSENEMRLGGGLIGEGNEIKGDIYRNKENKKNYNTFYLFINFLLSFHVK